MDQEGRTKIEKSPPAAARTKIEFPVLFWHVHRGTARGAPGGQRKVEKIRATFWDSKLL